jgi:hypothetical protein
MSKTSVTVEVAVLVSGVLIIRLEQKGVMCPTERILDGNNRVTATEKSRLTGLGVKASEL